MKTRSNKYWDKRSMERMAEYHRNADSTVHTVTSAYDKAQKDIESEINKIFGTFSKNGQLDPFEAKKILNQRIPNPLLKLAKKAYPKIKDEKIRRWLLTRMNAPAYRARITRLEALKENTYLQSKIIADAEIRATTSGYMGTINDAYYRTMFDVQQGIGLGFEFATMSSQKVEEVLHNPWSGEQFSQRIWNNTDALAKQVSEVITAGFMSGVGTRKMTSDLAERMNVGKHTANRLIRTETTYMANAAEMESYKEAEIEEYMFIATLDMRTSKQCQQQDKKVYKVIEAKPGVNMPPMHVFCRSTTRAYFGEEFHTNIQRRARNPITGKNELVPADTNYDEWRKGLEEKHGKDKVDMIQKQIQNKSTDKKQYDQYKIVLGKDAPKSFAAFQNMKYNNSKLWAKHKGSFRKLNAYGKIVSKEPKITSDLLEISKNTGVEMVGLDYRLKEKDSYLRKVNSDSANSLDSKVISETISNTNDVIRYTYQANGDKLVDSFTSVANKLEQKGYSTVKIKNTWNDKRNPYNGVNCIFESPDNQKFEIQFHTPESFELKNGNMHKLYEEFRLDNTSVERRTEISKEMFNLSSKLIKPKYIERIK